jgi:hypothetical protein
VRALVSSLRVSRRADLPVILSVGGGLLLGAVLVLSAFSGLLSGGTGSGGGAPMFSFVLKESGAERTSSGYVYNISTVWISNSTLTLGWIQFRVGPSGAMPAVNVTVYVITATDLRVGEFNTSNSTWQGGPTSANSSLFSFGGWSSGENTPFEISDIFQVASEVSLDGRTLSVAMTLPILAADGTAVGVELSGP